MLETQIEIATPPVIVYNVVWRASVYPAHLTGTFELTILNPKLTGFNKYSEWHPSWSIEPHLAGATNTTINRILEPGEKIKVNIDGMQFTAEIKVGYLLSYLRRRNIYLCKGYQRADSLCVIGELTLVTIVSGLHSFSMEPSKDGTSTIFRQTANFSGLLSFIMVPSLGARKLKGQFESFNSDLKTRCEAIVR